MLRLFNTLTRRKEAFQPMNPGEVRMYACGPTVYAPPHIGNYRSFLMADILRRYLEFKGYRVRQVMNLTDIDDKTIRDSAREGLSLADFTEKYTQVFFRGLNLLNIKKATVYARATETVDEMVKVTKGLFEKGYAYVKDGSVYFDVSKFKGYGKLSKLDLGKIRVGATVDADEYSKDSPVDFAMMKKSTREELERGIFYETRWGRVRPGWHIECSAISMKYLGESFDIHMGGIDLIFPHHENEIAQSEAYTGRPFVRYWVHVEHLMVEGQKMAKSLGNFITLKELTDKGYEPRAIRYLLLCGHYRQQLNFTVRSLDGAERTIAGLLDFLCRLREVKVKAGKVRVEEYVKAARERFVAAMDDDLNLPRALASLHDFVSDVNRLMYGGRLDVKGAEEVIAFMLELDAVLGLRLSVEEEGVSEEVERLIKKREGARERGDWKTADEIRAELRRRGIILEDTPRGTRWRRAARKGG